MILSYDWLHDYLPVKLGVDELSEILTGIGLEVEEMESPSSQIPYLQQVVIGEVLTLVKHENADKLRVATINVGYEILTIVCGAPNIEVGQKVVVAKVGAELRTFKGDIFSIKKAKIRGQESAGMVCSEAELGLSEGHEGIWVLPTDAPVGQAIVDFLDLSNADTIYHIGLTPNRTDAMSHLGVARNVCAYLSFHRNEIIRAKTPAVTVSTTESPKSHVSVNLPKPSLCPRYMGIVLDNISVKPSPEWLQKKLKSIGVKPINTIVDVTNFVLKECGQPLHAFDYNKIANHAITVDVLPAGTPFLALDGKEIKLSNDDLMICDSEGPLCMAGVYGGLGSGVSADTTTVFIESAYFDPISIRKSSLSHNLRTDAAQRFEKGVDVSMLDYALKRAVGLILELTEAKVASDIVDNYPVVMMPKELSFSLEKVNRLIGKNYQAESVQRLLEALDFQVTEVNGNEFKVIVPFALKDVESFADIAEEVLRIDGLNNIEIPLMMGSYPPKGADFEKQEQIQKLRTHLASVGFREIFTNSISNSKYFTATPPELMVNMLNNLSVDLDVLRPHMLHTGLEAIAYNLNRQQSDLKFFELGRIYSQHGEGKYSEKDKMAIWLTGQMSGSNWQKKSTKVSLFDCKGVIENILSQNGIIAWKSQMETMDYSSQAMQYLVQNDTIASIQKVSAEVLKKIDIKQDVWFLELDIAWLNKNKKGHLKYQPVNKYPQMKRDLAIVLDKSKAYAELLQLIENIKLENLLDFTVFDLFENEKLGENKKSIGMSFQFENKMRTLTVDEVDQQMNKIVTTVVSQLEATIRQ